MLAIQSIVLEGGILSGHTTFNHDPKLQHGSSTTGGIEEPFKLDRLYNKSYLSGHKLIAVFLRWNAYH